MALSPARLAALATLAAWLQAGAARGQEGGVPDAGAPAPAADAAAPSLEPPRALSETTVPYPDGAPAITDPVTVTVKILVDDTGAVQTVDLLTPPAADPIFDQAVIDAAKTFRFEPGRYGGTPVSVEITFSHTFAPPPPPPPPAEDGGPPLDAALKGRLVEMGTREKVTTATVTAELGGRHYAAESDADGRFHLRVPAGRLRVTVHAPGYLPFLQKEQVKPNEELAVSYYVERERYDPYEIVVVGDQRREETSRVTLRGPEIKQVPGTFGDPFRVIATLPGVASVMSLLPFPIVRGASPSSTGFLLDGTRVPLLFHLLSGPSVIHPEFIDEVQFFPGGAPVLYGGYSGGIIDGRTRRARRDEGLLDFDANLLQTGGLIRQPIGFLGATLTAAGRYGYPGLVLSLASNEISLQYWDYQLRLDGGNPRNGWTLFAFGARDQLDTPAADADPLDPEPPLEPSLILSFHRLDLRLHHGAGKLDGAYRVVAGVDQSMSAANGSDVSMLLVEPSARWTWKQDRRLTLTAGLEGSFHDLSQEEVTMSVEDGGASLESIIEDLDVLYTGSALVEALWRPTPRWLIRPGVRADVFHDGESTKAGVDPRVSFRYRLATRELEDVPPESDDSAVWLKGGVGVFHQPPRFILPLPGLDTMPIRYGLLRSIQSSIGVEAPFPGRLSLSAEAFFNYMDPTIFDLSVNQADVNRAANATLFPTTTDPGMSNADEILDRLLAPQTGRAYGLELLVRRQARSGVYGWVSYTLSRSERLRDGSWVAYDFDRSHLLNVVVGLPLKRNWDLGLRLQYQSGKPATSTAGYNEARGDGYFRIDLRIDKHAVWKSWLLDFYVDITNVAVLAEEVTPGATIRYVLPTLGVRGRF